MSCKLWKIFYMQFLNLKIEWMMNMAQIQLSTNLDFMYATSVFPSTNFLNWSLKRNIIMNFHVTSCSLWLIHQVLVHKYECFHYHNMQLLISLCWCCLPRYTIKPSAKCFYIDDAGTKSQTNFNIGVYHHILYMEFLLKLKTTGTQLWYNKCNFKSNSAIWQHIPCFLRETVSSPYWFYINKETLQGLERQVKELGVNITNGDVRHKLLVTKVNVKYLYKNLSSI